VELAPLYFSRDQLTTEAYFDATDGTWLNAKNLFAIYDAVVGWNGTQILRVWHRLYA
jgi:hypothetical protein